MRGSHVVRVVTAMFGLTFAFGLSCTDRTSENTRSVSQRAVFGDADFIEYADIDGTAQRQRANAVGLLLDDVLQNIPLPCDDLEGSCDLPVFVVGQAGAALCADQPPFEDQPTLLI